MRTLWWLTWLAALLAACEARQPPAAAPSDAPARAIITLAPHLAELVFAAGAGGRLVGTVEFSDHPAEALRVPRVGDAFRVDYEAIVALRPDLIIGWRSGNPPETLRRLESLNYRLVAVEPVHLEDIAAHLELIGRLAGTPQIAGAVAGDFRRQLAGLRTRYRQERPLRTYVQIAARPYFTVTDRHFLGQGLAVCGGRNVFGDLGGLAVSVSTDAILEAAPDVIVLSGTEAERGKGIAEWQRWRQLPAVRDGNLFAVDADLLSRPGPRVLDGIRQLCAVLDEARHRRP
jgi:iron complex transport system substrate-binding protein